ncbi:biotin--[acetyl-CoA-carboxylase] ligase [Niabella ginsenosidivorans]|uniref:Biotin--[acetyl-CoA-carboxylase] ligase n=1 Tax=Niabella ginsenosidivorans TaxID=1176587 RepID=A0A1A9I6L6_9BACT|nr:biotin--[acetyl-CoA-carboxylase] ligase [Niabella ginsenosidivorans]ANH83318.1 biotin--[acetyl-CoA-carboxylase] ligase [Niabella ginsenosidivorans]
MIQNKGDNRQIPAIIELSQVDSTNNYALGQIREGLAYHGLAIFAHEQLAGKGQRGKKWVTEPGQNIHLSLIIEPKPLVLSDLFALSALVAVKTREFLHEKAPGNWWIKWPNDLYFQDRKAGGILIENILSGQNWKWAVIGIGLNINQAHFSGDLNKAVSLHQITDLSYNCVELAAGLAESILHGLAKPDAGCDQYAADNLEQYNRFLFRKGEVVKFADGDMVFEAKVLGVTRDGKLQLEGAPAPFYEHGALSWLVP